MSFKKTLNSCSYSSISQWRVHLFKTQETMNYHTVPSSVSTPNSLTLKHTMMKNIRGVIKF